MAQYPARYGSLVVDRGRCARLISAPGDQRVAAHGAPEPAAHRRTRAPSAKQPLPEREPMQTLCACLCNQAGHTGVCRGAAEDGLRLAPGQPSIVAGPVCRGCFEAVRPLSTRYGPARVQHQT